MMPGLQAGLSALQAAQIGMDTVAQNLANASTPEYHRQVVDLRDRMPIWRGGLPQGTGVEVEQIRRLQDAVIEAQRMRGSSQLAANQALLEMASQVEGIVTSGQKNLHVRLTDFYDRLVELAAQPDDPNARREAVRAAEDLAREFGRVTSELDRLRGGADQELQSSVDHANRLAKDIAELNRQIRTSHARGIEPNDLLDRRDQLLQKLSEIIDVRLNVVEDVVLAADGRWIIGSQPPAELKLAADGDQMALAVTGATGTFTSDSGRIAGLLEARNQQIPAYRQQIDDLAAAIIQQVDSGYSAGVPAGADGFEIVAGTRPVSQVDVPLSELSLAVAAQSGTLYVGVTDQATGERQLMPVDIDPATQSLDDIAAALSAIDHLQAFVQPDGKVLQIVAENGYQFDFSGRPPTHPDLSLVAGTSLPRFHGAVTGDQNGELFFVAIGSGQIGVTDGLKIQVVNSSGQQVKMLDVGQGYAADTPLDLDNGLQVSFSAGDLVVSDSFQVPLVADSDTANLLAALGVQSLFTGDDGRSLGVHPDLLSDPDHLATSLTGLIGDTAALQRVLASRDQVLASAGQTIEQWAASTVVAPGLQVSHYQDQQSQLEAVQMHLDNRRNAVSGVDPNEELTRMLQFQRHFQAGAQVLRVVHETTADLLNLLG